jgi:hypothetical protein
VEVPLRIVRFRRERAGADGPRLGSLKRRFESRSRRIAVSAEEEICGMYAITALALAVLKRSIEKTVRMDLTEKGPSCTTLAPYQKTRAVTKLIAESDAPKKPQ